MYIYNTNVIIQLIQGLQCYNATMLSMQVKKT